MRFRVVVLGCALVALCVGRPAAAQVCQDPPGFTTAALGDSNTAGFFGASTWVSLVPDTRNCAVGAASYATITGDPFPTLTASQQLALAAADLPLLRTVVLAFFSRDVIMCSTEPERVATGCSVAEIVDQAEFVHDDAVALGLRVFIATAPPMFLGGGPEDALILAVDAELEARGLAHINFYDGFTVDDFMVDGIHVSPAGQQKRAALVNAALVEPDADSDGIPDSRDNCLDVANGPYAGACAAQQDGDADGYGAACDSDLNGNGATDPADLGLMTIAVAEVSTGVHTDLNCNGAADPIDQGQTLTDLIMGILPGPSGKACAGTVPCP